MHDRGGWPTEGPIEQTPHAVADWEKQTHALVSALLAKEVMVTDELRRGIESLPSRQYEALSYYERWSASIEAVLVEKGTLAKREIDAKVRELEKRWE